METLLLGLVMGLAAGISPGPLLVLVIVQTLRSGLRAGLITACVPLASDAVVIAVTLLVLSRTPEWVLPVIGLAGGGYLLWIAWETWSGATVPLSTDGVEPAGAFEAFRRALIVNLLSPHPWVSWATVLGPLLLRTAQDSVGLAVAFVVAFYAVLVGAKVVLAVIVARSRRVIAGPVYVWVMRIAALALVALAVLLIVDGALALRG